MRHRLIANSPGRKLTKLANGNALKLYQCYELVMYNPMLMYVASFAALGPVPSPRADFEDVLLWKLLAVGCCVIWGS